MKTNLHKSARPLALLAASLLLLSPLEASRIKDITVVEGGRDNQLVGYGLVIGLAGTGDSQLTYTIQSISNSLERFGIKVDPTQVNSDNVAAVMVTADIGPFSKPGSRLDVVVSSIGDAETIQGGVLLQTPMVGADGVVYAVAQGPIAVGGFLGGAGGAGGATVQKNHPTVGSITGGAIVEREIETTILHSGSLNLLLLNPDFTTSVRIADAINAVFPGTSQAENPSVVNVNLPPAFLGQTANFVAALGQITVVPDVTARVIINERTGTIVATQNVRLTKVAVSHGSLIITISNTPAVSQPNPFTQAGGAAAQGPDGNLAGGGGPGGAQTVVTGTTDTDVQESQGGFEIIEDYPTIERLTAALNALGVSTRDMISILQTMKKAGALQAELILN